MFKTSCDFIVPCGRAHSEDSQRVLSNLAKITYNTNSKVIIVGPNISSFEEKYPKNFIWMNTHHLLWPAINRNRGARISEKEILIFIDDDCYLSMDVFDKIILNYNNGDYAKNGPKWILTNL